MLHGGFVAMCLYFFFITHNTAAATANLGIALAFDPFSKAGPWQRRPWYQQLWCATHLTVLLGMLAAGW